MLLLSRVMAGYFARVHPVTGRMRALSGWAALVGWIGACGGTEPRIPSSVSLSALTVSFTALGQTQQLFPSVIDQDGKAIVDADVSWTSSNTGVASVSPSGVVTAVGSGSATVTATSGSAGATALVSVVQTPTQIQKVSGDGQTGPAGTTLSAPLVVQVNDAGGHPVQGMTATFTVTQGDGSVGASPVVTGADGRASTTFTTGSVSGSAQGVSVSITATALSVSFTATAAPDPTSFNIGLQYLSSATPAQQQAFTAARLRWQTVITADVEDALLASSADECGAGTPAVNQIVDDVLILVRLVAIDGPGDVLGGAGPCYVRDPGDPLTVLGVMQFDTADLQMLEEDGFLEEVILHEMGHVLGIGTLWNVPGLPVWLADPSLPSNPGADPHFTGPQAIGAFNNAGGVAYADGKVPVENTGGEGTADVHWREAVLSNELMTGFIDGGQNPLSRITIASLADMGYAVDLAAADGYSLLTSLRAFGNRPKLLLKNDILHGPIKRVDRRGRVTGVFRR
jgi:leishmanolysin/Big-like domain-containing protein